VTVVIILTREIKRATIAVFISTKLARGRRKPPLSTQAPH
jgi:hypothetical protein